MPLSQTEIERYQRQLLVEGWNQERLKAARVLVVGVGGLGGVSSSYLAAAGVGHLRLCDCDTVELSNLNRQLLFTAEDLGRPKIVRAAARLSAQNPEIEIETVPETLTAANADALVSGCDLIVDGLDNHRDRLILNQVSTRLGVPYVYGAISDWLGQTALFAPPKTACLACILPDTTTSSQPTPVFGALSGMVGSIQALLAVRYLMTGDNPLANALTIIHADTLTHETVSFERRPDCAICGSPARTESSQ